MAIFTVTEQAATGAGSLAAAIAAAEASAGADTIVFASDVTRIVTSATLSINSNIVIDADRNNDGKADVTLSADFNTDGTGDHLLFSLGTGANVTFDGVVFTRGHGVGTSTTVTAGAIINNGVATIRNSQFLENQGIGWTGPNGSYGNGTTGHIDGEDGGAGGAAAGAIFNRGIMSIQNTLFADNTGLGGNGGNGGAGYYDGKSVGGGSGGQGGNGGQGAGAILNFSGASLTLSSVSLENNAGRAGNGGNGGDAGGYFSAGGSAGAGAHGAGSILDLGSMTGSVTITGSTFSGGIGGQTGTPSPEDDGYVRPDGIGAVSALRIGTAGNDVCAGIAASELFVGFDGADRFVASAGFDTFQGGDGIDTIDFSRVTRGDVTFSLASTAAQSIGIGILTVSSVENAIGGSGNDTLVGTSGSNTLRGESGNDVLNSAGGGDMLIGGIGDDFYHVNGNDSVVELANEGIDTINAHDNYVLAAGVYVERLQVNDPGGTFARNLTGNDFAQTLVGGNGANILIGLGGADILQGGAGDDQMFGGADNDIYVVDDAGDVVDESVSGSSGVDTIRSSVRSIFLGDTVHFKGSIEQGAVDGSLALNLTGNGLNNYLQGNSAANTLNGLAGTDTMKGLGGNDVYVIDNAGDMVDESASGSTGVDTVRSSVISVNLGDAVHFKGSIEQVALDGGLALNATGNGLNNYLQGNSAANTLNGLAGADTMKGLGGNDTYIIDNAGDVVDESATGSTGVDTVRSSTISISLFDTVHYKGAIEQAAIDGTLALNAVGNSINNYLQGNGAANGINGGLGNDTLKGNGGADRFYFNTALNAATNVDFINDFAVDDTIYLTKAIFSGITATGTLAAAAFAANTTGLADDATDRIIYETDTGKLFYDADGIGGASGTLFAILPTGLALTNADFVVN